MYSREGSLVFGQQQSFTGKREIWRYVLSSWDWEAHPQYIFKHLHFFDVCSDVLMCYGDAMTWLQLGSFPMELVHRKNRLKTNLGLAPAPNKDWWKRGMCAHVANMDNRTKQAKIITHTFRAVRGILKDADVSRKQPCFNRRILLLLGWGVRGEGSEERGEGLTSGWQLSSSSIEQLPLTNAHTRSLAHIYQYTHYALTHWTPCLKLMSHFFISTKTFSPFDSRIILLLSCRCCKSLHGVSCSHGLSITGCFSWAGC